MFTAARISAGQRVLDIGSGSGETAMRAAETVGPTGRVLATDVSLKQMALLTRRRRKLADPDRISLRASRAEDLLLDDGSFDAALARNSLMYVSDLASALRRIRAGLRPGGRFVASIYGPLAREPFHAIPVAAVARRHECREPLPEYVQAFRLSSDAALSALKAAGFCDLELHLVGADRAYASLDLALDILRESPSLNELLAVLTEPERRDAWQEIADGFRRFESRRQLVIPGEQRIVVGVA